MAIPPPPDDTGVVSIRSVTAMGGGLVAVALRLPNGAQRTFIMSADVATFQNVTYCANAVGELLEVQRAKR